MIDVKEFDRWYDEVVEETIAKLPDPENISIPNRYLEVAISFSELQSIPLTLQEVINSGAYYQYHTIRVERCIDEQGKLYWKRNYNHGPRRKINHERRGP